MTAGPPPYSPPPARPARARKSASRLAANPQSSPHPGRRSSPTRQTQKNKPPKPTPHNRYQLLRSASDQIPLEELQVRRKRALWLDNSAYRTKNHPLS